MRIAGKDTVKDAAIQNEDDYGNDQRPEVAIEDTEKYEKESQRVDDAACSNVNAVGPGEKPHQKVRPEVRPEEYGGCEPWIEKVENGTQKEQGHRVGDEVEDVAVKQRRCDDTYHTRKGSGYDTEGAEGPPVVCFKGKQQPHEKDDPKGDDGTAKQ
jgi:hypothetical protein